ncbi:MAG: DUF262 domain-containing protein [Firmicutes bacterium]|nr:DUF262 domain-containing protein [Bacillota bacterium]
MKATEAKFLDFLRKSPQFIIPIYQRQYSWTERQCRQLWDDIIRAGSSNDVAAHFVGSIVYIEEGIYQVTSQSRLLVIDGQQRLTTISLLLEALARHVGDREPVEGFSAKKIRSYYLMNPLEEGDRAYKLLLTETDRDTLNAIVCQKELPAEHSVRVAQNFEFFKEQVAALGDDLTVLCHGLTKLVIVDIALTRGQDNPQLIFESMNSTGLELTQADLIRNFILMGLEPEHQTRLYRDYWRQMERAIGQEAYGNHFDAFMRHYLTLRTGEIPRKDDVYEVFKAYARRPDVAEKGVDALVADIHRFANYYCAMALGQEQDKELAAAFRDLRELKVDVAWPFLLELYEDYRQGLLPKKDFLRAVRLVESYVFRRAVCGIPANSLDKTFATFRRALDKNRYLESIEAHFLSLPSYRRFPRDEEFERELKRRDLYNFRSRSYWLRRIENDGRKEPVPVDEYTIEHILPQNENLSPEWQKALGPNWKKVQETWLHTLGNLTLTGYNSEYSDRPFPEKRDMPGGFRESPLRLNQGLGEVEVWNEEAIQARADRLAKLALEVWPAPALPDEVLERYRKKPTAKPTYTIEDHPYLLSGLTRDLFEAFRKEVLALDPCVTEEFLKLYVAYKAETNFVDVVPQKKRLLLSLNMKFNEVHDPRGLCKDVSDRGRWSNGDVEVGLSRLDDLPYVMGLVRQAFEKQMGNGETAS